MKLFKKNVVLVLILVLVVGIAGFSLFQYQKAQAELNKLKQSPQTASQEQVKEIVAKVGKLIILPSETPTLATITDISKLKDQPFFAKAKNGDKVLIYTSTKKAILYDEKADKILDIAPIEIGTPSAQTEN